MSSDQAPGAPSFGDLFDDPDEPLLPADAAPTRRAATPPAPSTPPTGDLDDDADEPTPAPVRREPDDADEPVPAEAEAEAGHDPDEALDEPASDVAFSSPYTDGPDDRAADEPQGDEEQEPPYAVGAAAAAAAAAVAQPSAAGAAVAGWDGTVDPAVSSAPAGRVDTGRLYRSAGAEGPATLDAIPAIDPSYVPRRPTTAAGPTSSVVPEAAVRGGGRGLTYSGVAVVVISVTVLVAFADALINDKLGILTGVGLAVSSIYAAVAVRRADIWAAVVMPPLAFLVAALTAGQLTLDSAGSLVVREAYMLFRSLAVNAPWILGTTLVCLVIVLVRRARS